MMSVSLRLLATIALAFCLPHAPAAIAQETHSPSTFPLTVRNGTVTFTATTNFSPITVHGKSSSLTANAAISRNASGFMVSSIDASVPVESLETGMELRDQHMRAQVFETAEGSLPEIRFTAATSQCENSAKAKEFRCPVAGTLAIRSVPRPFAIELVVREQKGGEEFKATGSGRIKLSDYNIERPSQLGVTVEDVVELQIEFVGIRASSDSGSRRGT